MQANPLKRGGTLRGLTGAAADAGPVTTVADASSLVYGAETDSLHVDAFLPPPQSAGNDERRMRVQAARLRKLHAAEARRAALDRGMLQHVVNVRDDRPVAPSETPRVEALAAKIAGLRKLVDNGIWERSVAVAAEVAVELGGGELQPQYAQIRKQHAYGARARVLPTPVRTWARRQEAKQEREAPSVDTVLRYRFAESQDALLVHLAGELARRPPGVKPLTKQRKAILAKMLAVCPAHFVWPHFAARRAADLRAEVGRAEDVTTVDRLRAFGAAVVRFVRADAKLFAGTRDVSKYDGVTFARVGWHGDTLNECYFAALRRAVNVVMETLRADFMKRIDRTAELRRAEAAAAAEAEEEVRAAAEAAEDAWYGDDDDDDDDWQDMSNDGSDGSGGGAGGGKPSKSVSFAVDAARGAGGAASPRAADAVNVSPMAARLATLREQDAALSPAWSRAPKAPADDGEAKHLEERFWPFAPPGAPAEEPTASVSTGNRAFALRAFAALGWTIGGRKRSAAAPGGHSPSATHVPSQSSTLAGAARENSPRRAVLQDTEQAVLQRVAAPPELRFLHEVQRARDVVTHVRKQLSRALAPWLDAEPSAAFRWGEPHVPAAPACRDGAVPHDGDVALPAVAAWPMETLTPRVNENPSRRRLRLRAVVSFPRSLHATAPAIAAAAATVLRGVAQRATAAAFADVDRPDCGGPDDPQPRPPCVRIAASLLDAMLPRSGVEWRGVRAARATGSAQYGPFTSATAGSSAPAQRNARECSADPAIPLLACAVEAARVFHALGDACRRDEPAVGAYSTYPGAGADSDSEDDDGRTLPAAPAACAFCAAATSTLPFVSAILRLCGPVVTQTWPDPTAEADSSGTGMRAQHNGKGGRVPGQTGPTAAATGTSAHKPRSRWSVLRERLKLRLRALGRIKSDSSPPQLRWRHQALINGLVLMSASFGEASMRALHCPSDERCVRRKVALDEYESSSDEDLDDEVDSDPDRRGDAPERVHATPEELERRRKLRHEARRRRKELLGEKRPAFTGEFSVGAAGSVAAAISATLGSLMRDLVWARRHMALSACLSVGAQHWRGFVVPPRSQRPTAGLAFWRVTVNATLADLERDCGGGPLRAATGRRRGSAGHGDNPDEAARDTDAGSGMPDVVLPPPPCAPASLRAVASGVFSAVVEGTLHPLCRFYLDLSPSRAMVHKYAMDAFFIAKTVAEWLPRLEPASVARCATMTSRIVSAAAVIAGPWRSVRDALMLGASRRIEFNKYSGPLPLETEAPAGEIAIKTAEGSVVKASAIASETGTESGCDGESDDAGEDRSRGHTGQSPITEAEPWWEHTAKQLITIDVGDFGRHSGAAAAAAGTAAAVGVAAAADAAVTFGTIAQASLAGAAAVACAVATASMCRADARDSLKKSAVARARTDAKTVAARVQRAGIASAMFAGVSGLGAVAAMASAAAATGRIVEAAVLEAAARNAVAGFVPDPGNLELIASERRTRKRNEAIGEVAAAAVAQLRAAGFDVRDSVDQRRASVSYVDDVRAAITDAISRSAALDGADVRFRKHSAPEVLPGLPEHPHSIALDDEVASTEDEDCGDASDADATAAGAGDTGRGALRQRPESAPGNRRPVSARDAGTRRQHSAAARPASAATRVPLHGEHANAGGRAGQVGGAAPATRARQPRTRSAPRNRQRSGDAPRRRARSVEHFGSVEDRLVQHASLDDGIDAGVQALSRPHTALTGRSTRLPPLKQPLVARVTRPGTPAAPLPASVYWPTSPADELVGRDVAVIDDGVWTTGASDALKKYVGEVGTITAAVEPFGAGFHVAFDDGALLCFPPEAVNIVVIDSAGKLTPRSTATSGGDGDGSMSEANPTDAYAVDAAVAALESARSAAASDDTPRSVPSFVSLSTPRAEALAGVPFRVRRQAVHDDPRLAVYGGTEVVMVRVLRPLGSGFHVRAPDGAVLQLPPDSLEGFIVAQDDDLDEGPVPDALAERHDSIIPVVGHGSSVGSDRRRSQPRARTQSEPVIADDAAASAPQRRQTRPQSAPGRRVGGARASSGASELQQAPAALSAWAEQMSDADTASTGASTQSEQLLAPTTSRPDVAPDEAGGVPEPESWGQRRAIHPEMTPGIQTDDGQAQHRRDTRRPRTAGSARHSPRVAPHGGTRPSSAAPRARAPLAQGYDDDKNGDYGSELVVEDDGSVDTALSQAATPLQGVVAAESQRARSQLPPRHTVPASVSRRRRTLAVLRAMRAASVSGGSRARRPASAAARPSLRVPTVSTATVELHAPPRQTPVLPAFESLVVLPSAKEPLPGYEEALAHARHGAGRAAKESASATAAMRSALRPGRSAVPPARRPRAGQRPATAPTARQHAAEVHITARASGLSTTPETLGAAQRVDDAEPATAVPAVGDQPPETTAWTARPSSAKSASPQLGGERGVPERVPDAVLRAYYRADELQEAPTYAAASDERGFPSAATPDAAVLVPDDVSAGWGEIVMPGPLRTAWAALKVPDPSLVDDDSAATASSPFNPARTVELDLTDEEQQALPMMHWPGLLHPTALSTKELASLAARRHELFDWMHPVATEQDRLGARQLRPAVEGFKRSIAAPWARNRESAHNRWASVSASRSTEVMARMQDAQPSAYKRLVWKNKGNTYAQRQAREAIRAVRVRMAEREDKGAGLGFLAKFDEAQRTRMRSWSKVHGAKEGR